VEVSHEYRRIAILREFSERKNRTEKIPDVELVAGWFDSSDYFFHSIGEQRDL
jgi:hypothetical protein